MEGFSKEYKDGYENTMLVNSSEEVEGLAVEIFIRNGFRVEDQICKAGSYYLSDKDLKTFVESLSSTVCNRFAPSIKGSVNTLKVYGVEGGTKLQIMDRFQNKVNFSLKGDLLKSFIADLETLIKK